MSIQYADGNVIRFVDTPGLFDTTVSNSETLKEIERFNEYISPGPHIFLLVINAASRFTAEEAKTVRELERHFGPDIYRYMLCIMTHADDAVNDDDERYSLSEMLEHSAQNNDLKYILDKIKNRFVKYHI